jgi:hypothetical protein
MVLTPTAATCVIESKVGVPVEKVRRCSVKGRHYELVSVAGNTVIVHVLSKVIVWTTATAIPHQSLGVGAKILKGAAV